MLLRPGARRARCTSRDRPPVLDLAERDLPKELDAAPGDWWLIDGREVVQPIPVTPTLRSGCGRVRVRVDAGAAVARVHVVIEPLTDQRTATMGR